MFLTEQKIKIIFFTKQIFFYVEDLENSFKGDLEIKNGYFCNAFIFKDDWMLRIGANGSE